MTRTERRYSWPRSILLGLVVAAAYFSLNPLFAPIRYEVVFRVAGALMLGWAATISWRYGWGRASWRSSRARHRR